jgi:hypothetical protein
MDSPQLIESDHSSVLIGWLEAPSSPSLFELQMMEKENQSASDDESNWKTLSDKIHGTSIKKKNLSPDLAYLFRIRYWDHKASQWSDFSAPSVEMRVQPIDKKLLNPPVLLSRDGQSLTIQWKEEPSCRGYLIRYREDTSRFSLL